MPEWRPMHMAPHEVPVRLFLPSAKWQADEHGRPKPESIEHAECVGKWDPAQHCWVDRDTGAKVYPSQWQPHKDGA